MFKQLSNHPVSSILRVSLVYTDAFLLLSGVVTSYNMAKELKTRGEIRWFCRFITRFIRCVVQLHEKRILFSCFILIIFKFKQRIDSISLLISRLTPALLAVLFWYAFIMEHIGSGPQWNNIIIPNAELCKRNAWTNLLYVQNFFPFEEMVSKYGGDNQKKNINDKSFPVRYAHTSIGLGYAIVAFGSYIGILSTI